jgi:hypothetical protein
VATRKLKCRRNRRGDVIGPGAEGRGFLPEMASASEKVDEKIWGVLWGARRRFVCLLEADQTSPENFIELNLKLNDPAPRNDCGNLL